MSLLRNYDDASCFPRIPDNLRRLYSYDSVHFRLFGEHPDDLSIELISLTRPELVTAVLEKCMSNIDREPLSTQFIWDLPIGVRIECLFLIALISKSGEIDCVLSCTNDDCNESIGITLTETRICTYLDKFSPAETIAVQIHENELVLRRPNGTDQMGWLEFDYADWSSAFQSIIQSIAVEGAQTLVPLSEDSVEHLSKVMEKLDPLVNLQLKVDCPYCNNEDTYFLDIERVSIDILREVQRELLDSVHLLASKYHWSEQEILSLPQWRRHMYISLIKGRGSQ